MDDRHAPSPASAIAFVLIRVWALTTGLMTAWFSLTAVMQITDALITYGVPWESNVSSFPSHNGVATFVTQLGGLAILALCFAIWFNALRVSQWVVKPLKKVDIELNIDARSLMSVGTALIGLFIVAISGQRAIRELYSLLTWDDGADGTVWLAGSYSIIQTLVGVAIFLGAFRIGALVSYLRTAGMRDD